MIKKMLVTLGLAAAVVASACWFTTSNFNACYIAGVNSTSSHYRPAADLSQASYYNGTIVDMPLTVYCKVSPRFADQPGEVEGARAVVKAVLQYKVLPSGSWVTVRTIENVSWAMDFANPVALFGRNTIDRKDLPVNTEILIRLYLTDGVYETGDLATDITDTVPNLATSDNGTFSGWTAPFVYRVKISGKRRASR